MICSRCGKTIGDGMQFCPYCGMQVVQQQPMNNQQMGGYQQPMNTQPMNNQQMSGYQQPMNNQPMNNQQMGGYQQPMNTQPMSPQQRNYQQPMGNQPMRPQQGNYQQGNPQSAGNTAGKLWLIIGISVASVALIIALAFLIKGKKDKEDKDTTTQVSTTEATTEATTEKPTETTTEATTEEPTTTEATTEAVSVDGQLTVDIINTIRGYDDFVQDLFEPLAMVVDVDGDGCREVVALYEAKSDGAYEVRYEVWHLKDGNSQMIWSSILFMEVGGNSGEIGIASKDGVTYLVARTSSPAEMFFDDMIDFYPFAPSGGAMSLDGSYFFEKRGNYEDPSTYEYIVGANHVSESDYQTLYDSFQWSFRMNLFDGPGNGDVKTFDDMLDYAPTLDW